MIRKILSKLKSKEPVILFDGEPLKGKYRPKYWMFEDHLMEYEPQDEGVSSRNEVLDIPKRVDITPELFKRIKSELTLKGKGGFGTNSQIAWNFHISRGTVTLINKASSYTQYKKLRKEQSQNV